MSAAQPPGNAGREPRARLAFFGLGSMGLPMASRLAAAGFPLVVWNRTPGRAGALVAAGARLAPDIASAAREADIALTMLADPAAVEAVVLGPGGLLSALASGSVLVEMSTVGPETARKIAAAASTAGIRFVDAPVYGSVKPAIEGTLVLLCGGSASDLDELRPVLAALGNKIVHAGRPAGAGQALKLAINAVGGHALTGLAVGLAIAVASGIEGATFLDALSAGAFGSPLVPIKGPKMLARSYSPSFTVDLTIKDLQLALETAGPLGVNTASLALLIELFGQASRAGLGERDLAAVFEVLRADAVDRGPEH